MDNLPVVTPLIDPAARLTGSISYEHVAYCHSLAFAIITSGLLIVVLALVI